MNRYQVEVRRTSYINMEIEANSKEEAEKKMWEYVEDRGDVGSAEWEVTLNEEII